MSRSIKGLDTHSLTLSLKIVIPKGPITRSFMRNKWDLKSVTPRGQYCEVIIQVYFMTIVSPFSACSNSGGPTSAATEGKEVE